MTDSNNTEWLDSELKESIDQIMRLHDQDMFRTDSRLYEENYRKVTTDQLFDLVAAKIQEREQAIWERVDAAIPKIIYTLDEVRELNKNLRLDSRTQQSVLDRIRQLIETVTQIRQALPELTKLQKERDDANR